MRIVFMLALPLLAAGCSSVRAPSLQEHALFVQLVRERLAQDNAKIAPHTPFDVRMRGARATVEYAIEYDSPTQLAFNPVKTQLRAVSGKWTVVSHKGNRPWWWHVLNHTVGVK